MTYIHVRAWMSLKFGQIRPRTTELAVLERLKTDLVAIYLIHFRFVGIARTCIISNFNQIGPHNMELSAIERLKNTP